MGSPQPPRRSQPQLQRNQSLNHRHSPSTHRNTPHNHGNTSHDHGNAPQHHRNSPQHHRNTPNRSNQGTQNRRYAASSDSEDDGPQNAASAPESGRGVRMTDVRMPSSQTVAVTVPAKSCRCQGKCSFDGRLTELKRDGKMGAREFWIVAGEMSGTIRQHNLNAGGKFRSYEIISIHKIQNCCLWKRFRNREAAIKKEQNYVNERMLFHGSSASANIAKTGFNKSCAKPAGMFGPAIYFAKHSSKSNQYVFGYLNGKGCALHQDKSCYVCERQQLLCRVVLGKMEKQKLVARTNNSPRGCNSVSGVPSAGGLRYPEYAIYRDDQAYPEYLITYKIVQ